MGNHLPSDIATIRVDMIENVSFKFGIESYVTNAIIQRLSSASRLRIITTGEADAVISGRIRSYSLRPIEVDTSGFASKYQINISMQIELSRTDDNSVIWSDNNLNFFKDLNVSRSVSDSMDIENTAILNISEEIADRVVTSMLMNF